MLMGHGEEYAFSRRIRVSTYTCDVMTMLVHDSRCLVETVGSTIACWHLKDMLGCFLIDNTSDNDEFQ
jgi:hypothetical protein